MLLCGVLFISFHHNRRTSNIITILMQEIQKIATFFMPIHKPFSVKIEIVHKRAVHNYRNIVKFD